MLPTMMAEMSLRMSPNRFEPTTTSKLSGRRMKFMAAASTSSDSVSISGNCAGDFLEDAIPQHHAEALRVGLGDRGDALLLVALDGEFEGEAHDALDAAAGEDRGLNRDFVRLLVVDEAAHLRVLALGVLADHDEIDVAALGLGQRRLDARVKIGGTHVGVLIEGAPDGQQQAVERGVIGNIGMAHGAEQDGVAGLQQIDRAGRHHAAPAEVVIGAPVEILKHEGDVVFGCDASRTRLAWGTTSVPTPSPAITAIVNVFIGLELFWHGEALGFTAERASARKTNREDRLGRKAFE